MTASEINKTATRIFKELGSCYGYSPLDMVDICAAVRVHNLLANTEVLFGYDTGELQKLLEGQEVVE